MRVTKCLIKRDKNHKKKKKQQPEQLSATKDANHSIAAITAAIQTGFSYFSDINFKYCITATGINTWIRLRGSVHGESTGIWFCFGAFLGIFRAAFVDFRTNCIKFYDMFFSVGRALSEFSRFFFLSAQKGKQVTTLTRQKKENG